MAVPATRTLIETEDASGTELTIRVTGYQWKWGYEYVDSGVERALHARSRQQRRAPARLRHRSEHGAELPAERRPSAGRAGGHQGAAADHGAGRHPLLVGAGAGDQEGCDPGLRQRGLVQGRRRTRPASIAASAPNCAAATTASCRSSSTCAARRTSRPGSRQQQALQQPGRTAQASCRERSRSPPPADHAATTPTQHAFKRETAMAHEPTPHTTTTMLRAASGAGCRPPTTRTSARCTWSSRASCSSSAARWRW